MSLRARLSPGGRRGVHPRRTWSWRSGTSTRPERPRNYPKRAPVQHHWARLLAEVRGRPLAITSFGQGSPSTKSSKLDVQRPVAARSGLELERPGIRLLLPRRARLPAAAPGTSARSWPNLVRVARGVAHGIVTTEAKAKAVRPIAEKLITKAAKGGLHNHRQIPAYIGDQEIAAILMDEIGPATPPARAATADPQARHHPPRGQRPHGQARARLTPHPSPPSPSPHPTPVSDDKSLQRYQMS